MKKVVLILFCAIILGVLFFVLLQFFVLSHSQKGALQVTSSPDSKIYLDGKYLGQTPLCKCEAKDMQKSGEYTIRLVPNDHNLSEFQEKITITEGVLTVIDRKFGKVSSSSGSVISLTPLDDKKATQLLVVSIPSGSKILLDNNSIGDTPILYKDPTESDHVLQISKEGYVDKTVRIRTPLGYKLTVKVYLSAGDVQQAASESAKISPSVTPTPQLGKVIILNTPTGFLRVRQSASIEAAEVGRVNPTEAYDLVGEQEGWFEIKLNDNLSGFISSQYAKKQ
jgi:hypothetical protein